MIKVSVALKGKKLSDDICVSIEKSPIFEVKKGIFYSFNECYEALAKKRPDVLLISLDLPGCDWRRFCNDMKEEYPEMKILTVISYDEYTANKYALHELTNGYISSIAWPKVIERAIIAVHAGEFFRHDRVLAEGTDEDGLDTGKLNKIILEEIRRAEEDIVVEEEPNPEWLNSILGLIIAEMVSHLEVEGNRAEMIEKLTKIMDATDKTRRSVIEILLAEEQEAAESGKYVNKAGRGHYEAMLFEYLLVKGLSNWELADRLNKHIDEVRYRRMELIRKLSDKNSMYCKTAKGEPFELSRRELQLLRLIAAGRTNEQISEILDRSVETIKTNRRNLIDKFGVENENSMTMVIKALRMGLLRLEEINDEL